MPDIDDKTNAAPTDGRNPGRPGERDVDPRLLELLVCPLTKAPLRYDRSAHELISDQAGLAFPIRNGVPIMLVDEARRLDDDPVSEGARALARNEIAGDQ